MLRLEWDGKEEAIKDYDFAKGYKLEVDKESSINFDTTDNIIIEGDNLPTLKLLQEEYKGRVKMIYIDPPYNTGNKGIYKDKWHSRGECKHSGWLNMMYPRLKLARELLRDDGVIFVSIDDHEQANLKLLMDSVFSDKNFISTIIWEKMYAPKNTVKFISNSHDYIICYKKSESLNGFKGLERTEKQNKLYKNVDNDPRGDWKSDNSSCMKKGGSRGLFKSGDFSCMSANNANIYPIINLKGDVKYPPKGRSWRFSKEKFEELKKDNRICFGKDGGGVPRIKRFLSEVQQYIVTQSIWKYEEVGHTDSNAKELKGIFNGEAVFDFPKGTKLIKKMIQISTTNEDIVLDFFAGSGTTGHAVMEMNLENKKKAIENGEDPELVGNRKYIMVQLPEIIDEKTDAYKAGYKKISEENPDVILDIGFKVAKIVGVDECVDA